METLAELIRDVESRTAGANRLDQLAAAAMDADHLGDLADHLVGHFVDAARAEGASWAMVGRSLGTTRQAAQQRFVAGDTSLESFTNRAAVVVLTAQNIARERGHAELLGQHLVLGLLAEWDGFAGQALEAAGATAQAVRDAIEASLPADSSPGLEHVPVSPGVRKALAPGHAGVAAARARLRRHRAPAPRPVRVRRRAGSRHPDRARRDQGRGRGVDPQRPRDVAEPARLTSVTERRSP